MFGSLRARLLLSYLLATGLVLGLVGASLIFFLLRNPVAERLTYSRLQELSTRPVDVGGRELGSLEGPRLQRALEFLERYLGARTLLVEATGRVVADSRRLHGVQNGQVEGLVPGDPGGLRGEFLDESGRQWLWVARPLGGERYLLFAALRPGLRALAGFADELLGPLIQAGIVGFMLSIVLAWLISRWVAGPLSRMAQAARAVARGDYQQQIEPEGPAEVRQLAHTFNEMVRRVRASRQSQRDFVANVSHELKTPLTSIQGFAQAILDGTAEDPQARRQAAQVIYQESDRLRRLVEDLLDLARIEAGQVSFRREAVDLCAVLEGCVERQRLRAQGAGIDLQIDMPPQARLMGDGDRLAQVFTNLIDNALKYTPPGGRVRVRGQVQGGWVTVHVDDTGRGIPPQELSRVFERFYQLDKARKRQAGRGAGLGLAISRQIVEAHGGRISAQSVPGKGSRFTVQLPLALPQDETLAQRKSNGH